jgi:hypothetical protein
MLAEAFLIKWISLFPPTQRQSDCISGCGLRRCIQESGCLVHFIGHNGGYFKYPPGQPSLHLVNVCLCLPGRRVDLAGKLEGRPKYGRSAYGKSSTAGLPEQVPSPFAKTKRARPEAAEPSNAIKLKATGNEPGC